MGRTHVKDEVHADTLENSLSLLKRAVIGAYHQPSIKHLQRYLNEFSCRFNRRVMGIVRADRKSDGGNKADALRKADRGKCVYAFGAPS